NEDVTIESHQITTSALDHVHFFNSTVRLTTIQGGAVQLHLNSPDGDEYFTLDYDNLGSEFTLLANRFEMESVIPGDYIITPISGVELYHRTFTVPLNTKNATQLVLMCRYNLDFWMQLFYFQWTHGPGTCEYRLYSGAVVKDEPEKALITFRDSDTFYPQLLTGDTFSIFVPPGCTPTLVVREINLDNRTYEQCRGDVFNIGFGYGDPMHLQYWWTVNYEWTWHCFTTVNLQFELVDLITGELSINVRDENNRTVDGGSLDFRPGPSTSPRNISYAGVTAITVKWTNGVPKVFDIIPLSAVNTFDNQYLVAAKDENTTQLIVILPWNVEFWTELVYLQWAHGTINCEYRLYSGAVVEDDPEKVLMTFRDAETFYPQLLTGDTFSIFIPPGCSPTLVFRQISLVNPVLQQCRGEALNIGFGYGDPMHHAYDDRFSSYEWTWHCFAPVDVQFQVVDLIAGELSIEVQDINNQTVDNGNVVFHPADWQTQQNTSYQGVTKITVKKP
ncbi:unnamed protein product, partial [Mesorhabditis spiculigera]